MLLVPLLILGIALYISGKRELSSLIFLFFLFGNFQLIPDELIGIKAQDFAIVYVGVLFIWGCIKYDNFIPKNNITLIIVLWLGFIIFGQLLSHFYYHIGWSEIIRTSRQHLLILSYFIFRRVSRQEIDKTLHILFIILLFQCCLYIIQAFTGLSLLTGSEFNFRIWRGFYRCYNLPFMVYFFVFYALFRNPFKGWPKYISMILPIVALSFSVSRSLIIILIIIICVGYLWEKNAFNSLRNLITSGVITLLLITIGGYYASERTIEDINKVATGDFLEVENIQESPESTFLYRIGHFYERYLFITEETVSIVFGLGFMADDSSYTNNRFNFIIGLDNEKKGGIAQLDTPDIAWSNFIVRYGIVGTILFLIYYILIIIYYTQKKKTFSIRLPIILYLFFLFGISFTCDLMYKMNMLIFPLIYFDYQYES